MISSQRPWPLDHEAGHYAKYKKCVCQVCMYWIYLFIFCKTSCSLGGSRDDQTFSAKKTPSARYISAKIHVFTPQNTRVYTPKYTCLHPKIHVFTSQNTCVYTPKYTCLHPKIHVFTPQNTRVYIPKYTCLHPKIHVFTPQNTRVYIPKSSDICWNVFR